MAVHVPLAALDKGIVRLSGRLTPEELGIEPGEDPCLKIVHPFDYDISVEKTGDDLFVEGVVESVVDCQCVRCLEPFAFALRLDPWNCVLPLEGEEKVSVVNDCVDLTPYIREDMVLAFPQHPLCKPDCSGLAKTQQKPEKGPGAAAKSESSSSAWSALDKLKL